MARVFGETPSPVVRPPAPPATYKQFLFALLAALWIAAGLFGRDPWKPQETDFVAAVAAQNGAIPQNAAPKTPPSLYLDIAAESARLFSPLLPLHEGARMINALLLAGGFLFIGLAAGGIYGGWLAVLLALGITGFVVRAHLLNLAVAEFFGAAMMLWGAVRLRRHALSGGAWTGLGAAFLFAAASPAAALCAALGVLGVFVRREWRRASVIAGMTAAAMFFTPALLSAAAEDAGAAFAFKNIPGAAADFVRLSAWGLFPVLPLAAAVLWRRRTDAEMFLCLTMTAAGAAHFMAFGAGNEEGLFLLIPPLAVFVARGMAGLPEDCAIILDWFAIIIAGVCCVGGMWTAWILWQSGIGAEWMEEWRARFPYLQTPSFSAARAVPAALITIFWIGLAANFGRSNERAILNWSCGVTVVWCVFNLLWTPAVDSGKSYRRTAESVAAFSGDECVSASASASAAAAQLYYFGVAAGDKSCDWHFSRASENAPAGFVAEWTGGRYDEKNYVLYRRLI